MAYTQVSKREGRIPRVKPEDAPPVIELDLERGQYLVSVELENTTRFTDHHRKTDDWKWTAFVVTPFEEPV